MTTTRNSDITVAEGIAIAAMVAVIFLGGFAFGWLCRSLQPEAAPVSGDAPQRPADCRPMPQGADDR